jgi:hypothetical protein
MKFLLLVWGADTTQRETELRPINRSDGDQGGFAVGADKVFMLRHQTLESFKGCVAPVQFRHQKCDYIADC